MANIKPSKTHLQQIGQSGGFLGKLLGPLLKTGLPLMKNLLKLLAKSVLIPLGLKTAAAATDIAIQNLWIRYDNINYFEWWNGWYYQNN